jgi:hypothetical protein
MAQLDIPISAELEADLALPPCSEVRLPLPKPLKVKLPTGGSISAIADISKAIPTDCSMTFSLMVQIAPLLASMECLLKILKLLKPLVDAITHMPPSPKVLLDIGKAAADLAPCFLIPTPANMLPFVKDLICLILRALKCLLSQLKSLLAIMSGLSLKLDAARAAGNIELAESLQCAMDNAEAQGQHLTTAIEPIGIILDLAGAVFGIVGVEPIKLPSFGSKADVQSLNATVQSLQGVVATLQVVADALGGCD